MIKQRAPLHVACVGAGYFSQFHVEAWRRLERVNLTGITDHDPRKAAASGVPAFDDLDTLLASTKPDVLDIITPPHSHLSLIKQAGDAGIRTIICQKPFCASINEARQAVVFAKRERVRIIVHENFRFQPWYRAIKQYIETQLIGELLQITFRLRPGDGQGPNAYLDRQPYFQQMPEFLVHETAVHWIDVFRYLLGEPTSVYADLRQLNPAIAGEDAGHVLFAYPDGRRALFDGNRLIDHAADNPRCTMGEALIEGTKATLSLNGDGSIDLRHSGSSTLQRIFDAADSTRFGGDCVHALQQHVVNGLLDGTPLENLARDYLNVLQTEILIYQSSRQGRRLSLSVKR